MISKEMLLLKIVDTNGRISLLRERGLSYAQIAMMIEKQQCEGNIIIKEEDIILTDQGAKFLKDNISKIIPKEKDHWILPQEHFYRKSVSFNKIILPKHKKI